MGRFRKGGVWDHGKVPEGRCIGPWERSGRAPGSKKSEKTDQLQRLWCSARSAKGRASCAPGAEDGNAKTGQQGVRQNDETLHAGAGCSGL
eukprot:362655-Chlamydomonas_euryale.AAC.2